LLSLSVIPAKVGTHEGVEKLTSVTHSKVDTLETKNAPDPKVRRVGHLAEGDRVGTARGGSGLLVDAAD
jgi:hypothetical protein